MQGRSGHASGIVVDQETKEKITVVCGGKLKFGSYLDATELLIGGKWQKGKNHTKNYCFIWAHYF